MMKGLALGFCWALASCVSSVTRNADGSVTRTTSFAMVDQIRAAGEFAAVVKDTGK
jgi:hypothetical protein